ncbi:MAG: hypothetical protein RMY64_19380 [Nostoc sp. DedQUE08]|uniref:hypothetical protein n=1 Tax=unclassified Nostoc TaxID=2593658 RepID=UPI002AD5B3E3|nr:MULTISPECIES: hypothetical protein [unclassified Nostoc]MDZ8067754.1 hypothetical protein [Nostoc sp. DedQUE08]MDZ8095925.1 hypothetical protein [Nostoc sp. DedQUE05]
MTKTPNIPEPDPTWDYYIEWHKLIRAKTQLDKLIEFISKVENATEETQEILIKDLQSLTDTLESI